MDDGDRPADDADPATGWESLADWVGEATELARRGMDLAARVRGDWEDLARSETPWTSDTLANESINSWEHLTPFVGEVIQHSIDLGSWALRSLWPTAPAEVAAWRAGAAEAGMADTVGPYLDVSARAVERMADRRYDSADLVEDWAVVSGMAAKDVWRAAAATRDRSSRSDGSRRPGGAPPRPPTGADDDPHADRDGTG